MGNWFSSLGGLLRPDAALQYAVVGTLLTVVPAAWMKMLMLLLFNIRVSFWMVLLVVAVTVIVTVLITSWVGLYASGVTSVPPVQPVVLLLFASLLIQLVLLTAFVPDQDVQLIAMWQWLCVTLAHYAVLVGLWLAANWFFQTALLRPFGAS